VTARPTLDEIIVGNTASCASSLNDSVLAEELRDTKSLALSLLSAVEEDAQKIRHLEGQARALQEDGALADLDALEDGRADGEPDEYQQLGVPAHTEDCENAWIEHVAGCKQPWKPYPACRCVEILTERAEAAERDNAQLAERLTRAERREERVERWRDNWRQNAVQATSERNVARAERDEALAEVERLSMLLRREAMREAFKTPHGGR
jgi:hypothetical protein